MTLTVIDIEKTNPDMPEVAIINDAGKVVAVRCEKWYVHNEKCEEFQETIESILNASVDTSNSVSNKNS